jgi:S-DNA-T family DNA segregation ATPase FtsK/SpoIIIE
MAARAKTSFYRHVRNYPDPLPEEVVKIEPPPQQPEKDGSSWLVSLLTPLAGGLMSLIFVFSELAGALANPPLQKNKVPYPFPVSLLHLPFQNALLIIGGVSILPISIGISLLVQSVQKRAAKRKLKAERELYEKYLEGRKRRLSEIATLQRKLNARLYPDIDGLVDVVAQRDFLWERRPTDADFLTVRVGRAPAPLRGSIDFQEDFRANYDLELLTAVRALISQHSHIDDQPSTISLPPLGTLAITGPLDAARALARAMLCQIVTFHSPREVRLIACYPPAAASEWQWMKWLPHAKRLRQVKIAEDEPELLCMLASTIPDVENLIQTQLKPEMEQRQRMSQDVRRPAGDEPQQKLPHLIMLLDSFSPDSALAHIADLEDMLGDAAQMGMTVICLVAHEGQEPATLQGRLTLTPATQGMYLRYAETMIGGNSIEFITPDTADVSICERIARMQTPLQLIDADAELDLSEDIRLLALHNAPSVDRLQIAQYWSKQTEQQLLCAPIGIQKNGSLILDLKEMAVGGYGPHGLVVGATGSGKSELLRTVVTSLAMLHDPTIINFVLVDFKGGAAFADFENLPHVAGIITNLENDPLLISRMYASLTGEQNRRQAMLASAGNLSNIRQYQAKWRKNPSMEPMPYLLVIVDEFAQLIANHDEFLALFTRFGQVGRSLGIHMMLGTQRVDEGRISSLEGHLRYRICLRTFKPEESNAVIGTADAYYLPPVPGSGYFKVDDDIYMSFKTAIISMPYVPPSEQEQKDPATLIRAFSANGKLVPLFKKPPKTADDVLEEESRTEMQMVVERIRQVPAPPGGWRVHAVWQPPLKEQLLLSEVLVHCGQPDLDGSHWYESAPFGPLVIPIGMLDRPAEQVQEPVLLDFSGVGGHLAVVGVPRSGKSTLLRSILTSFIVTHTPREVQLYGIDFGGGLLRIFDGAPHVGAICSKTERDKIRRVVRRMRQVLAERETLFSERSIDSMATFRRLSQEGAIQQEETGDVFLFVDNFGQLQVDFENEPEITDTITVMLATGLNYGVHVVLTVNQWIEIRPRLRANIGSRLELRLNDPGESEIDRRTSQLIPPDVPGRGLLPSKLLFQCALPIVGNTNTATDSAVQPALEALIQRARASWQGPIAPQIRVLPLEVHWTALPPLPAGQTGVPIGLEESRVSPMCIDLQRGDPHFIILGDRECGKTTLMRTWIRGIEQLYTPEQIKIVLIDYRKTLVDLSTSKHMLTYAFNAEKVQECIEQLKTQFDQRIEQNMTQSPEQLRSVQSWEGQHIFIFVDDYEVVATPDPRNSNPLNPLEGLLQSAQEVGFHLIVARRLTGFGATAMDPTFRGLRTMEGPGLLMRGDPIEGRQVMHKQSVSDSMPTGRGLLVRRGSPPILVQVGTLE